MAVYIVTGKLGGGKTLISVKRIQDKLQAGCRIATNLDLKLEHLVKPTNRTAQVIRIPDKPTVDDLHAIGKGADVLDEERYGLLVLDECGTWFNSRSWQDKARQPVNEWFLHARKLRWDVILIIQDVENLDTQARRSIAEHTVFCRRTDRLAIPFISTWFKLITGSKLKLPKAHLGRVVYGISPSDMLVDRWACRGVDLYRAYDTEQKFLESYAHGPYSLLPPWHTHGRYRARRGWKYIVRMTKIYWKRYSSPVFLGTAFALGSGVAVAMVNAMNYDPRPEPVYLAPESPIIQSEDDSLTDPIIDRLDRYRVKSSWSANQVFSYTLQPRKIDPEGDFQGEIKTRELQQMGYDVQPVNRCSVVISKGDQQAPVYCF